MRALMASLGSPFAAIASNALNCPGDQFHLYLTAIETGLADCCRAQRRARLRRSLRRPARAASWAVRTNVAAEWDKSPALRHFSPTVRWPAPFKGINLSRQGLCVEVWSSVAMVT